MFQCAKMHPSTNSQQDNNRGSRVNILAISHFYFLYVGCQFIVIDKIAISVKTLCVA